MPGEGLDSVLGVLLPSYWSFLSHPTIPRVHAIYPDSQEVLETADALVTALLVVLVVAWLLSTPLLADLARHTLDPRTRRALLAKKPYVR